MYKPSPNFRLKECAGLLLEIIGTQMVA